MNKPVVVADAGPLIALAKCGQLALLPQVFGQIHLPHAVLLEAAGDSALPGALAVSSFAREFAQIHPNRDDELFALVTKLQLRNSLPKLQLHESSHPVSTSDTDN